jgi:hypothetical protein
LLVKLASLGILLRVAGQACPYTLPREMVSVGWWKRGWELYQYLLINLVVQAILSKDAVVSVVFDLTPWCRWWDPSPSFCRPRTFRSEAGAHIDNRREVVVRYGPLAPGGRPMITRHWGPVLIAPGHRVPSRTRGTRGQRLYDNQSL